MDDIFEGRRKRLRELIKYLNIKDKAFASKLGKKPARISNLLNGHSNISAEFAFEVTNHYEWLNLEWLISGKGDMKKGLVELGLDQSVNNGEPSTKMVGNLYDDVIDRFNPSLTAKQDLTLRQACYRVMVDNPGQPWASLLVGARVYLRFIEAYPNLAIPDPDSGNP